MQSNAYLNRVATAVPDHEVNKFYLRFGASQLADHPRRLSVFERMTDLSGIEHRYSCFAPADDLQGGAIDRDGTSVRGSFASTAKRMQMFEAAAPALAQKAVDKLLADDERSLITHLIVTTCTGFSAPGIDLELVQRCGLPTSVERTIVGFMGCYAAINALKLSRHIVRSDPKARVLIVNIELCTLHLRETTELEKLISFCLWGDGCAASLVTAEPHGILLESFHAIVAAERQGADELAHSRRRLRHGAVRPGPRRDPRDAARRASRPSSAAGPSTRSICGRCIPAGARCSTRSSGRLASARPPWRYRARCSGRTATCRRRR